MSVIRWAAVAVTALLGLMNIGTFMDDTVGRNLVALGVVLGAVGLIAAIGLALSKPWGRNAVVGIGAVNVVAGAVALLNGIEGAWIGIAVAALGTVLGLMTKSAS